MRCESCGNENEMNNTFCTKCGSKLTPEQPNLTNMYNQPNLNQMYNQSNNQQNNQPMNMNQPMNNNMNQPMNNNMNQPMNFNNNPQNNSGMQMKMHEQNNNKESKKEQNKKKNGTISLIMGIACIPLFFFSNISVIPVAIVGMIIGLNAGKKGLAGSIVNGVVLALVVALTGLGVYLILNRGYKMYGTYKCTSYYDSYTEEDLNKITEEDLEIEFNINVNDTFEMTSKKNEVEVTGNFELTEEKTSEMYDTDYYYLKMTANNRKISGKEYTEPFETEYVFALSGDKRNAAYVYNPKSTSQYICKKDFSW